MNAKDLSLFKENTKFIFSLIAGILIILLSVYCTIDFPHRVVFLGVLLVGIIGFLSYDAFLAIMLFIITFVLEGDFILHIGLGLKIREGFTIHPIDMLFALTIFIFILKCLFQKGKHVRYPTAISLLIIIFAIIGLTEFVRGASIYGFKNALWDARYLFFFLNFFIAYEFLDTESKWRIAFKIILGALALHTILLLGLSVIRDTGIIPEEIWLMSSSEKGTTGRVSSSNGSFLIVLLPFLLFFKDWFIKQRLLTNFQLWLSVGSFIIMLLIGMGRISFFLISINLIILSLIRIKYLPRFGLVVVTVGIFLVLFIATTPYFRLLLEGYTERLTDFEYLGQSALGRILSFEHGIEMFLNNKVVGTGFGSTMNLIWITGEIASEGLFIDNAFATILAKTGLIGGLPFLIITLMPLSLLFELIRNTVDKNIRTIYKGLFWTYPSLWFSLTMSSAYLIHSRITIVLFCIYLAYLTKECMNLKNAHASSKCNIKEKNYKGCKHLGKIIASETGIIANEKNY